MAGPFLIGKRVQLRPFEEEDAPVLAEWINDPEIRTHVLARFPKSIKDEKEWLAAMSAGTSTPRDLAFGIELRRGGKLIGSIGLHGIDWVQRRAMTGMFLHSPGLRGRGYGTEAKNLLIGYAFAELGLHSLWANVYAENTASIRALEKQGYVRSGVFRKATLVGGRWVDNLYYDLLREEWEASRARKQSRPAKRGPQ